MPNPATLTIALDPHVMEIDIISEYRTRSMAVQINGSPRSGKTVFAEALRRAFIGLGANVVVEDGPTRVNSLMERAELPFEGTNVTISVEQHS